MQIEREEEFFQDKSSQWMLLLRAVNCHHVGKI